MQKLVSHSIKKGKKPYFKGVLLHNLNKIKSCHPEVFLGKGVLKICIKFTEERPYWSAISIKLLHIFRTHFPKNTSGGMLQDLKICPFVDDTSLCILMNLSKDKDLKSLINWKDVNKIYLDDGKMKIENLMRWYPREDTFQIANLY